MKESEKSTLPEQHSTASPLVIEGLTFRYHSRPEPALHTLSLTLERGELLLVAGASGCGKTTLIRCINGLIPRTYNGDLEGSILLDGQDGSEMTMATLSQTVGTVLQDPERQILGSFVLNEVAFGLENLGLPREEILQRVDETLDYLGISRLRERETFYLSGGEKQKVALAGVLAMRPSILLLDEPLASLDPASAQEALSLFRRLADEGVSIILVEHRVEDAFSIHPDRVLFMQEGQVTYCGPPDGLADVVDYRQVKMPAPVVIQRAASEPPPTFEPAIKPNGREPLVAFGNVSFAYEDDGPTVIRDVNLTIRRGDVIALLGPNGAGKTTLFNLITGQLKPERGRILFKGEEITGLPPYEICKKGIARSFQIVNIFHRLTVFENVQVAVLAHQGRSSELLRPAEKLAVDKTEELLESVGLLDKAYEIAGTLSHGDQKVLEIAIALGNDPELLILDEPTAGMSPEETASTIELIKRLAETRDLTILFCEHDMEIVFSIAKSIMVMHQGQTLIQGKPEEVRSDERVQEAYLGGGTCST